MGERHVCQGDFIEEKAAQTVISAPEDFSENERIGGLQYLGEIKSEYPGEIIGIGIGNEGPGCGR
jgi:hypothetical protein